MILEKSNVFRYTVAEESKEVTDYETNGVTVYTTTKKSMYDSMLFYSNIK